MLPSGSGFTSLTTFHPAACALRSGFSDLSSDSRTFAMIVSKSAVLSGLIASVQSATSPSKVNAGAAWACAPSWPCQNAGSNMRAPASSNPESRRICKPPGKGVTLQYTLIHERLEILAVESPDVDLVSVVHRGQVQALVQPESGEQRVFQALLR